MKFFKHFCDARRGFSMQTLLEEFGHIGTSCYWMLVEMCAEKLSEELIKRRRDTPLDESICTFRFHKRTLLQELRIKPSTLQRWLTRCQQLGLYTFTTGQPPAAGALNGITSQNLVVIYMPKLLEILEREAKRPRRTRGRTAGKDGKNKEEDKDKDKEKEEEGVGEETKSPELNQNAEEIAARIKSGEKPVQVLTDIQKRNNTSRSGGRNEIGPVHATDVISKIIDNIEPKEVAK